MFLCHVRNHQYASYTSDKLACFTPYTSESRSTQHENISVTVFISTVFFPPRLPILRATYKTT